MKGQQAQREIRITQFLRMMKNSVMQIQQSDASFTTIDLLELAALDSIGADDLAKIDGITNGAGAAGKALVLDLSGDVKMPLSGELLLSGATLAATGSSSSDAAVIINNITSVTGADGAKGVALPLALAQSWYLVINTVNDQILPVYPIDSGNDLINEQAEDVPFLLKPGGMAIFACTSATQFYADQAQEANPVTDERTLRFEVFDDFLSAAINTGLGVDNWIVFEGGDSDATAAATVAGTPEGQILMGSGGVGVADDKTVLSLILITKGSLVSLGMTVFECRVSFDQITGTSWGFGLGDVLANATEIPNFKVNSGTVTDDGGVTNGIAIMFSTDATATTLFQAVSTNGNTIGNSGNEETLTDGPTANTFDVLRIEVDADGDARFYINGVLRLSRTTAVATNSLLIPYIWGDSGDDADVATDLTIDYIKFQGARPSSNA